MPFQENSQHLVNHAKSGALSMQKIRGYATVSAKIRGGAHLGASQTSNPPLGPVFNVLLLEVNCQVRIWYHIRAIHSLTPKCPSISQFNICNASVLHSRVSVLRFTAGYKPNNKHTIQQHLANT